MQAELQAEQQRAQAREAEMYHLLELGKVAELKSMLAEAARAHGASAPFVDRRLFSLQTSPLPMMWRVCAHGTDVHARQHVAALG